MKQIFIVFISCLLFFACSRSSRTIATDDVETIIIPAEVVEGIENMVSEYEVIALENTSNSLLGSATKIRVVDDKVFVSDHYMAKKLVVFDRMGKYLYQIGRRGRGPGEYQSIHDFEIDYVNREVLIVDLSGRKALIYDLDGRFKRYVTFDFIMGEMGLLGDGTLVNGFSASAYYGSGSSDGDHKLLFFTPDGKTTQKFLKEDHPVKLRMEILDYLISKRDGNLSFAPQFHNMIYEVSTEGLTAIYKVEYSSDLLTRDKILEMESDDFQKFTELQNSGKRIFTGTHAVSPQWLCLSSGFGLFEYVFYDRFKKKPVRVADLLYGRRITIDEDNWFWATGSSAVLIHGSDEREWTRAIRTASENVDNNPVLVRYKLK
ncbi:MAG TPA: hypothetical protein DEQ30_07005 [Porphyromonadaceae bacterium]|nr:hypothetical protein [Porphyromonadaceae bacterium]